MSRLDHWLTTTPEDDLAQVQKFMREYRDRAIAQDVANIAAERALLEGCENRALRRVCFRSIRRSQRSLARAADYIVAERVGGAA